MSARSYSALQVVTAGFNLMIHKVAEEANRLELQHGGVVVLPINGQYYLFVYPAGSKVNWIEDDQHITKLKQLTNFIDELNAAYGENERPVQYMHTRMLDTHEATEHAWIVHNN